MIRDLWAQVKSQLRFQIIFPFLILTIIVMVAGAFVVVYYSSSSAQERLDNQLATVTRAANDTLISQEGANLQFLREVSFAPGNTVTGAPGVADALANGDTAGLQAALDPFFQVAAGRTGIRLDRLIAFDRSGTTVSDFDLPEGAASADYITHEPLDLSSAWFTERVLQGATDGRGDKYAGLIEFADTNELYFATISPVYQEDAVVGGLIAAMRVDELLAFLAGRSQAAGVMFYDSAGTLMSSTFAGQQDATTLSPELLERVRQNNDPFGQSLYSTQTIGTRDYQFAYVPLNIRGASVGVLAPGLSREYVASAWEDTVWPVTIVMLLLAAGIALMGFGISGWITAPIGELARTAEAISGGNHTRRAQVISDNEIGKLATSFNEMASTLVLYGNQAKSDASQRDAIFRSIVDGIVVCDDQENILMVNPATRTLLGLGPDDPIPARFSDIPLQKLNDSAPGYGAQRSTDLYMLGERVLRLSAAPVISTDLVRSGSVCVLQDMTEEVAVDRARTNFIGTISHELRTPLTVIRGNADLLMRGLAGPLEDDQKIFVDSIRQHSSHMTSLIQNVIVIAGLDSGSLSTELEPVELQRPIEEASWPQQNQIKAKGLTFKIELPEGLPQVLADFDQVRMVMHQLIDNARLYTSTGSITVRAQAFEQYVQVDVHDTGRGIPVDMQEQIFERFIRGDGVSEGINSSERGIGLGLAISKQLVERQGGKIWVTSAPGQGSTFSFTLRYAHATPSPEKSKAQLAAAA